MKSGIYKISFIGTKWFYIGSATNLQSRKSMHIKQLKDNKHYNKFMQRAFNKHEIDSFVFEIIEYCKPEKLIEREQYYIDTLNPNINIRKIADSNKGLKWSNESKIKLSISKTGTKRTEETKQKISKNHRRCQTPETIEKMKKARKPDCNEEYLKIARIKVNQYDFNGNFIKEWISISFAAKSLNILVQGISACCRGICNYAGNYIWRYADSDLEIKPIIKYKIYQYDKDLNLIRTWNSILEINKKLNINRANIWRSLNNDKLTAGGYVWKRSEVIRL